MNDEFQVLIPNKEARIPAAKPAPTAVVRDGDGFQPLLAALNPPCTNGETHPCKPPEITLQREGDRITQICIQCGCGQIIELGCHYPC